MFILILCVLTTSDVFSFDFGSKYVKLCKQIPGRNPELLLNSESTVLTPNYISFNQEFDSNNTATDTEWVVGSESENLFYKKANNSLENPLFYLNSPYLFPYKFISPLAVMAISISEHIRDFRPKHDRLIFTIPSTFSYEGRYLLIKALNMLNYKSVQLLDSNTAIATLYAFNRDFQDGRTLFIDIGAKHCEVSLWNFSSSGETFNMTLVDYRYDDKIGGEYIDDLLMDYVVNKLDRSPREFELPAIRRSIIKAKHRLAVINFSTVDLADDFGISIEINNNLVKELAAEMAKRFNLLLENIDNFDFVELIGGSTRLPMFLDIISENFHESKIKRSTNVEEAVAKGGVYFGGIQAGLINGPKIMVSKPSINGLQVHFNNRNYSIYEPGDFIERKYMNLKFFRDFNFSIYTTYRQTGRINSALIGSDTKLLMNYSTTNLYNITRNITSKITKGTTPYLRFTFGLVNEIDSADFISAALTATIFVNVTIENNTQETNTSTFWPLAIKKKLGDKAYTTDIKKTKKIINNILSQKREKISHRKIQNNYESYIIDMLEKIYYDYDILNVTTTEEREEMRINLAREKQMIQISSKRVNSSELSRRLTMLKNKYRHILTRASEYSQRPYAIKMLKEVIENAKINLTNIYLNKTELEEIIEQANNSINEAEGIDPKSDPSITVNKLNQLKNSIIAITEKLLKVQKNQTQNNNDNVESTSSTEDL